LHPNTTEQLLKEVVEEMMKDVNEILAAVAVRAVEIKALEAW